MKCFEKFEIVFIIPQNLKLENFNIAIIAIQLSFKSELLTNHEWPSRRIQ